MEVRLLACPKCGDTSFEIYNATIENFFYDGRSLSFLLMRCKACGWETHPRDEEQIRQLLISMLSGQKPREGFIYAYEWKERGHV